MTKIYILILGLLTSSIGFSQKIKNQLQALPAKGLSTSINEKTLINSISQNKDGETLVWEDNFNKGYLDTSHGPLTSPFT